MRLRPTLLNIAMLVSAGTGACGGSVHPDTPTGAGEDGGTRARDAGPSPDDVGTPVHLDAGHPDKADTGVDTGVTVGCGGCGCGTPTNPMATVTPAQACAIAADDFGAVCATACGEPSDTGGLFCELPNAYSTAYYAVQVDGGSDAGPTCPAWTADVVVQCGYACLGRRTDGIADAERPCADDNGAVLAERAYLEAVSVHAFARLESELAAHGAPVSLRRRARKARRDEVRHTAMMARLARRFGGAPESPSAPSETPARSLFEIARENAVEGCVRETYGAVVGLVEARVSPDADVRRAMRSIADDECRHAELSWDVAAWALPQLSQAEREDIQRAAEGAIAALALEGDPAIVELLATHVWAPLPATAETAALA